MFDIGWSELVVIGIVALIAIGPKELPAVLRTVGQWMGKVRRMAAEFQSQFQEAMREAEMADLKKQVDEVTSTMTQYTQFDPIDSVRKEVESLSADPFAEHAAAAAPGAEAPAGETAPQETAAPGGADAPQPAPAAGAAGAKAQEPQTPEPRSGTGG
jgi:sec-independent protein translocase protein TatB